jgi:hypothetical protein
MAGSNKDDEVELPSQGEPVNGEVDSSSESCSSDNATGTLDLIAELKRNIGVTRLPANIRAQIGEQLPSPEKLEQLYKQMQTDGGVSSEDFMALLGIEGESRP